MEKLKLIEWTDCGLDDAGRVYDMAIIEYCIGGLVLIMKPSGARWSGGKAYKLPDDATLKAYSTDMDRCCLKESNINISEVASLLGI